MHSSPGSGSRLSPQRSPQQTRSQRVPDSEGRYGSDVQNVIDASESARRRFGKILTPATPAPSSRIPTGFRLGIANVRSGRSERIVGAELTQHLGKADVWVVVEAQGYRSLLASVADQHGYTARQWAKAPGQGNLAIVVHDGLAVTDADIVPMTSKGWFTPNGGSTPPKWSPVVDVAGMRIIGVHYPPSIERTVRPAWRWKAAFEHTANLGHLLTATTGPVIVAGDWNVAADNPSEDAYAASLFARHGLIANTARSATFGKRRIDYAGATMPSSATATIRTGSDHHWVVVTY